MKLFYNKSFKGYSHTQSNKLCQDYSDSYVSSDRIIVTCADGHGGNIYFRSELGSKFASDSLIKVLSKLTLKKLKNIDKIKLDILCEWNFLVEQDIEKNPINIDELDFLNDKEKKRLIDNPVIAYGTTLNAIMYYRNKLICVQLGDGGIFIIDKKDIYEVFEDDEDAVANLTYSLCSDDAYEHLKFKVIEDSDYLSVFISTDGLLTPYQSVKNFKESFITPTLKLIKNKGFNSGNHLDKFLQTLANEKGVGDDVSFGCIIDYRAFLKL